MIVIHQEEVIKISSHLLGRRHGCIDINLLSVRERRKYARKHVCLDSGRNVQLGPDPFLFRRHSGQILNVGVDILFHFQQALRKHLHLISGADIPQSIRNHVVVLHEQIGRLHHLLHRSDQSAHQRPGGRRQKKQGDSASCQSHPEQIASHISLES